MIPRLLKQCDRARRRCLAALLFCTLVILILAACGSTASGGPGPTPMVTVTLQALKCGSIQTNPRGLPLDTARAKQAGACFWQAYQKCQPAMLQFTRASVDTVASHMFSIHTSGQNCSVTDSMQHTVVPAKPSEAKTYACTAVTSKSDGLHFSACGEEGDVVVPM